LGNVSCLVESRGNAEEVGVDIGKYLLVLAIGVCIVLTDGLFLLRKSPAYLDEVYQNPARSRQVAGLVGLMFLLVMLGAVALISSISFSPGAGVQSVLARVGVVFIVTAAGHGITFAVLSRLREQELATQVTESGISQPPRRVERSPS
jgi:hypothetical protein